jgi:hypothetical protein
LVELSGADSPKMIDYGSAEQIQHISMTLKYVDPFPNSNRFIVPVIKK